MNKQQFIKKCKKELKKVLFGIDACGLDDCKCNRRPYLSEGQIDREIQSKLSECWDMAKTQKIKSLKHGTKKYYRGWSKLGKIMDSLKSKQEEGKI